MAIRARTPSRNTRAPVRTVADKVTPSKAGAPNAICPPQQTVMVMQGGGAVGAFHLGVYQALHEGGKEPDWVIGTSIGAINAALIAGNHPQHRLSRLRAFWERMQSRQTSDSTFALWPSLPGLAQWQHSVGVVGRGIPAFFKPYLPAWFNPRQALGIEKAAYCDAQPLRDTLGELVDFDLLARSPIHDSWIFPSMACSNASAGRQHRRSSR